MAARGMNMPAEVQKVLSPTAGDVTLAPAAGVIVLDAPTTVAALTLDGSDLAGRLTALDSLVATRAAATHSHALADVTGLQTALDQKAPADLLGPLAVDADGIVTFPPVTQMGVTRQLILSPAYVGLVDGDGVPVIYFDRTGLYAPNLAVGGQNLADLLAAKADALALVDYATTATLTAGLAGKAAAAHGHAIANVTGLQAALDLKADAAALASYATTAALTTGLAAKADTTALTAGLATKASTAHTHTTANVTGLDTALAGKAPAAHTHDIGALAAGATSVTWDLGGYSCALTGQQINLTGTPSAEAGVGGGGIYLTGGDHTAEDPGSCAGEIDLYAGNATAGQGGSIYLVAGTGPAGDGSVDIRGQSVLIEGISGDYSTALNVIGTAEISAGLTVNTGGLTVAAGNLTVADGVLAVLGAGSITGTADAVQLLVRGHATQNANILEVQTSNATKVVQVGVSTLALGSGAVIATNNDNTIAIGAGTNAADKSKWSVIIGYGAHTHGDSSNYGANVVVGPSASTESGVYSGCAIGGYSTVKAHHGVAIGGATCSAAYGFAIGSGSGTGIGSNCFAIGVSASAGTAANTNNYNFAFGTSANCDVYNAVCFGNFTKAYEHNTLNLNSGVSYTATSGAINFQTYCSDNTGSSAPIRNAAYLDYGWTTATEASRAGYLALGARAIDTKKEGLRCSTNGAAATLGFFGATPVVKPAALTAANAAACTSSDAAVIANLRTRIGELETKLQALGLLS